MGGFLRKLFGQQPAPQSIDDESDLEKFYTDAEYARQIFESLATSTTLPKRLLVIHGLGGVGKSTLLKIYALTCHKYHIPAALVASEEVLSPVDILADWEADLKQDGIVLPTFQKTLNHYRAIQTKVEAEAKRGLQAASHIADNMGKTVAKTAISMAASAIPIVGPFVGAVGGEGAEAFIDWLRGFLTKPDLELYLDPAKRLDDDFLNDLSRLAVHQRIVLLTDTYEQMTALDDWMRELVRKLPKNVLIVLAGRIVPAWDRSWQEWMGKAEIVELKEMTQDNVRILVQRYYSHIRGGNPDAQQVEAIVQFARGLPMVATTVVQLWVKYGLEDFQSVRPQVVADLVDRLLEGVPPEMRPAFESAAVLRYFNVEALNMLLDSGSAETLYFELRRWPFVRSRKEGLAVHDAMREMINEALKVRTPERFRALHERAARYYDAQMATAVGEDRERYTLEKLYHHVRADEVSGIQLFQETAEEFTGNRLVNRLRALLNDVNNYPLENENSQLWRAYYNSRLAYLEARINNLEEVYQSIGENKRAESKLRAYALCDWGILLCRRERLRQPGMEEKAIRILEASLTTGTAIDLKLALSWVYLGDIYIAKAQWEKSSSYLDQPRRFFTERNDYAGLLTVLEQERGMYGRQGNLRKLFEIDSEMWKIYTAAGEPPYLRYRFFPTWEWVLGGRYAEREQDCRSVVEIAKELQDQEFFCAKSRDLALCLGFQGKCTEALMWAEESLHIAQRLGSGGELNLIYSLSNYGTSYFKCGMLEEAETTFLQAIAVAEKIHAHLDYIFVNLASVYEVMNKLDQAKHIYQLSLKEARLLDRNSYACSDLTGLVRVNYAQKSYTIIPSLWTEAAQLAQEYEYNDHFASLYLSKGHIVWDTLIPEWESGFDSALHYYQLALIHALRFNRFLLDEALAGREHETPLRTIIRQCLEHGEDGKKMLMALRDWWQSGMNDPGTPRPDTISPLPEAISLLEAERIARGREPGDGALQKKVVEQISAALGW